jgi:hypothetical protein
MVEWKISNLYVEGSSPFCRFVFPNPAFLLRLLIVSQFYVVRKIQNLFMIVYKLDKNIDAQKVINDIQNLINKFQQTNPQDIGLLTILIKSVSYDDTSLIPKLEHKEST